MHKRALLLASILFLVGSSLAFAADSVTLAPPTGPGPTAAPALAGAAVLMKHHNTLGNILADGDGRTLYLYTKDERNKSNCSGACLRAWPALLTVEAPQAGPGVAGNRLATITRDDGTKQVAYNGWPLYYFASDATPGETKGQDVGGVWFVVHAAGGGPVQTNAPINIAKNATFGNILVEASGRVLYLYSRDELNKSNCSGGCLLAWPALLTVGDPKIGEGIDAKLVGSISREDGARQLTYNGWPLYYYAPDEKPGDTKGQDVGKVWYVLHPEGGGPIFTTATVNLSKDAALGSFLMDHTGRTLYLYTRDEPNKSNCSGACLQRWPALLTLNAPVAGEGVNAQLFGTTKRDDGTMQVTYNSWPLYYYAPDAKPGDTIGQNVGGVWFVLSAAGRAIGLAPAALPSTGDDRTGSVMGLGAVLGVLLLASGLWMRRRVTA
ncbi:MAG TPA: LPXTG cell wall anchor domain-containing protein [Dehalococcoidia bacterium]|nr:LPXTG cell wall anchor domain-containing protein [Dehalococcoidia bacterium]